MSQLETQSTDIGPGRGAGRSLKDRLLRLSPEQRTRYVSRATPAPLRVAGLWFAASRSQDSEYSILQVFRVEGFLDNSALRLAVEDVWRHHDGLRAAFPEIDGTVFVVSMPARAGVLEEFTWNGDGSAVEDWLCRPFDLENGPLARAALFRRSDTDHVLAFALHHIIGDRISFEIMMEDLRDSYACRLANVPAKLQPASSLIALARHDAERRNAKRAAEDTNYWRERFHQCPEGVHLPYDKHGRRNAAGGAAMRCVWPVERLEKLKRFATDQGVSVLAVLLAGLAVIVGRWTDADEAVLGTTIVDRPTAAYERAIGFFVRTVPLRIQWGGLPDVQQLVLAANQKILAAVEHDEVEFPEIVTAVGAAGGNTSVPLFSISCEIDYGAEAEFEWPGLQMHPQIVQPRAVANDLKLVINSADYEHSVVASYDAGLFEESTINAFLTQWGTVLDAMMENASGPPKSISLEQSERCRALQRAFQKEDPGGSFSSLLERVRERAGKTPSEIILFAQEEHEWLGTTAADLFRTALAVAGDLGDRAGQFVGLVTGRTSADVAAILGIQSAGGAFVPIDPELPADRIRFLLSDSGVNAVVGMAKLLDRPEFASLLRVAADCGRVGADWAIVPQPEHPAYALYTSGTTGAPKAVIVTHSAVEHLHRAMHQAIYDRVPGLKKFAINAPFSFDASLQLLMVLGDPGTHIYLIPHHIRREPAKMVTFLREQAVDAFDCTPTTARLLVEAGLFAGGPAENPVRMVLIGGESISQDLWTNLTNAPTAAFNMYGPTECTVNSTFAAIQGKRPPHIGGPLPGVGLWIVGEDGHPVPPGVVGEIWISGPQVGLGYLNRPELTVTRFVKSPSWLEEHERVFLSGDRARFAADGRIVFEGRRDGQMKINGVRVELEAIEAVLLRQPGIRDAAVGVRSAGQETSLVAFLAADNPIDAAGLRRALLNVIPRWEIPQGFVQIDHIPRLPSGKTDRAALKALSAAPCGFANGTRSSLQSSTEEKLAQIWRDLLGCDVSPHDNFFSLGGHSLLVLRMLHRIRADMGTALPLNSIFASATLGDLARTIDEVEQTGTSASTVISLYDRGGPTVVLFHPLGGDILAYRELVKVIRASDIPCRILGVRSRTLARGHAEATSAGEMIEVYARDLKEVLSDSPVYLAGWSLGGLIALGVGNGLEDTGYVVDSIEVWDCSLSNTTLPAVDPLRLALRVAFGSQIDALVAKAGADSLNEFISGFQHLDPESQIGAVMKWAEQHSVPARATIREIEQLTELAMHHAQLFQHWEPSHLCAPIHAVYSHHSLGHVPGNGWNRYTSGPTTERVVQATHYSMMREPVISQTASFLIKRLREAK